MTIKDSSTKQELCERRDRLRYNAACLRFFLGEFEAQLQNLERLSEDRDAYPAPSREQLLDCLLNLEAFVKAQSRSSSELDKAKDFVPAEQIQVQIVWIERMLNAIQGEIQVLEDVLADALGRPEGDRENQSTNQST